MSAVSEALITRVIVRGYRSLEHVDVQLTPLTVLVGPNASGKTSFLDALAFVQNALTFSPTIALSERGGFNNLLTAFGSKPPTLSIKLWVESRTPGTFQGSYGISFKPGDKSRLHITEKCEISWGLEEHTYRFTVENGKWIETTYHPPPPLAPERLALPLLAGLEYFAPLHNTLTTMTFYYNNLEDFGIPQPNTEGNEYLLPDGKNAVNVLYSLQKSPAAYQNLLQSLTNIVPSIQKVRARQTPYDNLMEIEFAEAFQDNASSFEYIEMSDGTLYALKILLAAYQENVPTLMAFEEPENTIHPGALAVVADVLQEAALRTQVLLTTHSPDLITRFEAEQLRAVERTATGTTCIAPIAEAQRDAIRQRLFTAGELHRIEGLRPQAAAAENRYP